MLAIKMNNIIIRNSFLEGSAVLVLQRTSLSYFGKFLQGGTLGERIAIPWLRPFQNAKNP